MTATAAPAEIDERQDARARTRSTGIAGVEPEFDARDASSWVICDPSEGSWGATPLAEGAAPDDGSSTQLTRDR